jgi:succinate dehydrogenase/fumarate reductase flavoprotein subunit
MESVSCDVLVVGSGAGGLSTAITAQYRGCAVIVIEKQAVFGGTTARSGGWLWVPGNPLAAREQATDRVEDARTYIARQQPF